MAEFINPLDWQTLFVNVFAGSMQIFTVVAILVFGYLSARFRFPNVVTLIVLGLFVVFMAAYMPSLYLFVIVFAGFAISYMIGRLIKN